jgi:hypothetical protein
VSALYTHATLQEVAEQLPESFRDIYDKQHISLLFDGRDVSTYLR